MKPEDPISWIKAKDDQRENREREPALTEREEIQARDAYYSECWAEEQERIKNDNAPWPKE